jgi:predicted nucleic acid-binding protein
VIVLDASVIIAHLDSTDQHHRAAAQLLADNAFDEWASSAVTLAEVLVGPARRGEGERVNDLLTRWGVHAVAVPEDASLRLAALRSKTPMKLPDCCALLAALQFGAAVATFDDRLAEAARRQGLRVVPRLD